MQMPISTCLAALLSFPSFPAPDGAWYHTPYPIWIVNFLAVAFAVVFLLRRLLSRIPGDAEDAARIDGAGFWRFCWHAVLPLAGPVLALGGIFILIASLDDYMASLIPAWSPAPFTLSASPLPASLTGGGGGYDTFLVLNLRVIFGFEMAGALLLMTPMAAILFLLQRYLRKGRLTERNAEPRLPLS